MKNLNIFILIGGLAILMGTGCLIFLDKIIPSGFQEEAGIFQQGIKLEVSLIIDYGDGNTDSFQGNFRKEMTAFDLLKEKTEESGLTLKTKTYDIGVLIEAIGDKENGQDGKYWLYYVDREMPMVSADKKELKPGSKVEFKFEASIF